MNAYPITEEVYRIPGGFGSSGENYGGILIANSPPILIGASGSNTFVSNLLEALDELNLHEPLKIFYPAIMWEEIVTAEQILVKLPNVEFHVHEDLWEAFSQPREFYLKNRFHANPEGDIKNLAKKLPKRFYNVIKVNKLSNIETDKTKILIIPSPGPQKGHMFVYSRDHRLLCTGVILGITPSNSKLYYIDKTGSFEAYRNGLKFLDQAKSEVAAPLYDEPFFTTHSSISTIEMSSAINTAKDMILKLNSVTPETFKKIHQSYSNTYAEDYNSSPYRTLQFTSTVLYMHLEELVKLNLVNKDNEQYHRN
ncbi:MAG: hypothetical protein ACW99Q_18310 [Candidatus Kariarchaeaceae archaeon]